MKGVVKRYGPARVLKGVDITGEAGEVHALMGENGAGKSTLMKILSGAVRRDEGEVLLDGEPAELGDPTRAWELGIHAVYQEFSLVPNLSVAENIRLGQKGSGGSRWWVDWRDVNASARKILEEIGFAGIDMRKPVSEFSVAGRQMVEIAKAVAEPPRILILDEPSAVLSGTDLERLFGLVRRLAEGGTLVFYISHRLDEVFEIADRITVLKDGELVGTLPPDEADERTLIRMMVGRTLEEIYPERDREPGEEVLTVSGLSREGSFSDASFGLARGEILGLFGLVGSGRTSSSFTSFKARRSWARESKKLHRLTSPREARLTLLLTDSFSTSPSWPRFSVT
jgi:ABC-type sugar transport system ATPase subunit